MKTSLWIVLVMVGSPIVVVLLVVLVTVVTTVYANKKGFQGVVPSRRTKPVEMPQNRKPRVKKMKQTIIRLRS